MEEERFVSEVRAMERTLYRVARGYLRTWDECADAVQEAQQLPARTASPAVRS